MNQRGQALLFVIVVMSVALAIGVAISTRTLSTISRVSTTDTAARVLAAAEGGAERFLSLSDKALVDAISGDCPASTTSNGTGGCLVEFEPVSGDKILAVVDVLVAYHGDVSEGEFFPAKATWGKTTQINLTGYGGHLLGCNGANRWKRYLSYVLQFGKYPHQGRRKHVTPQGRAL